MYTITLSFTVVAEMMKTLNYVNMFNHGINEVWYLLKENSPDGAKWQLKKLQEQGTLKRIGPDFSGHWVIVETQK